MRPIQHDRVILFARDGEAQERYLREISGSGIRVDVAATPYELHLAMQDSSYSGLLVDLVTKMMVPKSEQAALRRIFDVFPVIQLRLDRSTDKIGTLYQGQPKNGGNLTDFLINHCLPYPPRKIRNEKRKEAFFNLVIYRQADGSSTRSARKEKTVTINISPGGCFIFSNLDWEKSADVWLEIRELSDQTPIQGEIRWGVEWGKTMQIPGVGIRFKNIKKSQLKELYAHYNQ